MSQKTFDDGWNSGLADIWSPPFGVSAKDLADYKEGWNQARAEKLILLGEKYKKLSTK